MSHIRWRLLTIGFVVAAAGIAGGHWVTQPHAAASPAASTAARKVAVVKVTRGDLARDISFSAEARPYQEADLHAKVAGYLKSINVDIGDQVKAGETLATLEIVELKDDLDHATAAFHDAQLNYDRVRQVIAKRPGLLAQEEVDTAQTTYEMAKANRERAATMLSYATISAPFDGIITKRYVDPGAMIQAGTNSNSQAIPVVHIAENVKLRLTFPVPESVVPQVHVGTPVEVTISATGQKLTNKVARTAGKIDTSTRTMDAEVDIDNPDRRIAPGMYAYVKLLLEQKTAVLTLPVQAVALGAKPTVWRIANDGKIEDVPVTLGFQTDSKVEILSGLHEGDEVLFGSRNVANVGDIVSPKLVAAQ